MQTFTHNNTTITCDDSGVFHAKKDGADFEAASLAAMKKKLDKANPFPAFDALDTRNYGVHPVRVVGVTKPRASWRRVSWKFDTGEERERVIEDTPANRELCEQMKAQSERHEAERKRQENERIELA